MSLSNIYRMVNLTDRLFGVMISIDEEEEEKKREPFRLTCNSNSKL